MSIISGAMQAKAAKKAARAQERAAAEDRRMQQQMYDQTRGDLAPWRDSGLRANSIYENALGLNGAAGAQQAQSMFQTGPGYQFQMDQGLRALDRSAAARGMLNNGAQGETLVGYGQGLANQEWGNWLANIANLSTTGQNAAAQTGSLGLGYAGNMSNAINNQGAAKASGIMGSANAWSNAIGQLGQVAGFALGGGFSNPTATAARGGGLSAFNNGLFGLRG